MTKSTIDLATTIPVDQISNAGEPVFPELRALLIQVGATDLLPYVDAREAYGVAKYGQTLLTGDGRHTPTEILNEALDLLAYATKAMMADRYNPDIAEALLASIEVSMMWLKLIDEGAFDKHRAWTREELVNGTFGNLPPWTQEELDRAEAKAKEWEALFVEESE